MTSDFLAAYLTAALWTEDPAPGSGEYVPDLSRVTDDDRRTAAADCERFCNENAALLAAAGSDAQNGHDFLLTRNGHGVGFWERGYGETGDRLTDAAHGFGEWSLDPITWEVAR